MFKNAPSNQLISNKLTKMWLKLRLSALFQGVLKIYYINLLGVKAAFTEFYFQRLQINWTN